ncbi:hypothetical protein PENTCL1PPCAC_384, partial [Pristionchus entomophagus]
TLSFSCCTASFATPETIPSFSSPVLFALSTRETFKLFELLKLFCNNLICIRRCFSPRSRAKCRNGRFWFNRTLPILTPPILKDDCTGNLSNFRSSSTTRRSFAHIMYITLE